MTCIIGYVDGTSNVYLGADTCITRGGYYTTRKASKLSVHGDIVIGWSGAVRQTDILQHAFVPPERATTRSIEAYIKVDVMEAFRSTLATYGYTSDNDSDTNSIYCLLCYQGTLWEITEWYEAYPIPIGEYAATGSGNMYALAALEHVKGKPVYKIKMALHTAAKLCPSVDAPFDVWRISRQGTIDILERSEV